MILQLNPNQGGQLLAHSFYNCFGLDYPYPAIYAARKAVGGITKRQRLYPCISNFDRVLVIRPSR